MTAPHRAPDDLGDAGRELWQSIVDDLGADLELEPRELAILAAAGRQADVVARLEQIADADGETVPAPGGTVKLHPAVSEARQGRVALARLLGELKLPSGVDETPRTAASARAQHAANTRWSTTRGVHRG